MDSFSNLQYFPYSDFHKFSPSRFPPFESPRKWNNDEFWRPVHRTSSSGLTNWTNLLKAACEPTLNESIFELSFIFEFNHFDNEGLFLRHPAIPVLQYFDFPVDLYSRRKNPMPFLGCKSIQSFCSHGNAFVSTLCFTKISIFQWQWIYSFFSSLLFHIAWFQFS